MMKREMERISGSSGEHLWDWSWEWYEKGQELWMGGLGRAPEDLVTEWMWGWGSKMSSVCLKITSLLFTKAQNCKGGVASKLRLGSSWEEKDNSFGKFMCILKGTAGEQSSVWERRSGLKGVGVVRIKVVTNTYRAGAPGFLGRAWGLIRMGHGVRGRLASHE